MHCNENILSRFPIILLLLFTQSQLLASILFVWRTYISIPKGFAWNMSNQELLLLQMRGIKMNKLLPLAGTDAILFREYTLSKFAGMHNPHTHKSKPSISNVLSHHSRGRCENFAHNICHNNKSVHLLLLMGGDLQAQSDGLVTAHGDRLSV